MLGFLNTEILTTRVVNSTAAGTTGVNGTVLDQSNFDGVRFTASLGTLTSTQVTSLKAQQGNAANGSDMADIAGAVTAAAADGDSNKLLILDVQASLISARYVRCVVNRGTANAVIDSVIADQYQTRTVPTAQTGSTISQSLLAK